MLRRKPTAINLTTEDIASYEDARRESLEKEHAASQAEMHAQRGSAFQQQETQNMRDPNDELRPLPGDRTRGHQAKTREERLGLGNGGGSRG
ncbi:hypothetical protein QTJ16_004868 [Diplocarpon rosae]|uniref:Anaphase-promoting complex subunit CDC26 n=1 Tax=Diplocarpon rosae TaxID=946125 RepID=A0AAD9SXV1_9HELO|nr:hypothetical protein QTJ16_004868 [Diplocarpon rosae]PBP21019.1 hypothetical protein BUE80_DR008196 [Diplocarpon rosae]